MNVVVEVAPEVEGVLEVVSEVLASAAAPQFGSDLCQCFVPGHLLMLPSG